MGLYQGTASQAAEKLVVEDVLKGRGFNRAEQVFCSCHSERASAREESAFQPFSAGCLAVANTKCVGFSRCDRVMRQALVGANALGRHCRIRSQRMTEPTTNDQ
jgi:hypothetical protein